MIFVNSFFAACEIAINCFYLRSFLGSWRSDKKIYNFIVLLLISAVHIFRSNISMNLYANLVCTFFINTVLAFTLFSSDCIKIIFSVSIYMSILMTADVLTTAILSLVSLNSYGNVYSDIDQITGSLLINAITFLLCAYISKYLAVKVKELPRKYWIKIMLCPIVSFASIIILDIFAQAAGASTVHMFTVLILFAVIFIVFNYLVFSMFESYYSEVKMTQMKEIMMNQENSYRMIENNEANIRVLRHNIEEHLQTMRYMLEHKIIDAPKKLMESIETLSDTVLHTVYTSNIAIDSILNMYRERVKERGIRYTVKAQVLSPITVDPLDINTILCNILNNAIEACEKVDEKFISVTVGSTSDKVKISVCNSSSEKAVNGNSIKTTKADTNNHGLGLPGVKAAVERHGGILALSYENGVFYTDIVFENEK